MARKEDKQPQYLPLIVKAKLHTGGRDYEKIKEELKGQGFTCKQMKGMVREGNYFDGIVLYLSKWNWDNHESWHLYNWDDKDDKEVMLGIYEAEQYHPQAPYRYRDKSAGSPARRGGQHRPRSSQKAGGSSRRRPVPEEKKTAPATQTGKQGQQIP